jgi:YD repeat-containing protein
MGNLTGKAGVTYTYPDPGGARPHAVISTSNGGSFGYDDNGNMTSRRLQTGGLTYAQTWDHDNRLATVTLDGQTTSFTYDGNGVPVKKVVSGQTTVYVGNHYEVQTGGSSSQLVYAKDFSTSQGWAYPEPGVQPSGRIAVRPTGIKPRITSTGEQQDWRSRGLVRHAAAAW